jgi:hypothetical protein
MQLLKKDSQEGLNFIDLVEPFLSSCINGGLSRRAQLHRVSYVSVL